MQAKVLPATSELSLHQLEAEPKPLEIAPERTALVIVDMQNGYLAKGGYFDLIGYDITQAKKIIALIEMMSKAARSEGLKVIHIVTVHPPDLSDCGGPDSAVWYKDGLVRLMREHPEWQDKFTVRGTWGAEIVEELKPQEGDIVFEKMRYSAFFQTNLDTVLKTFHIKYLMFTGVATNICVEATIRDAYYLGYFPVLVSDATTPAGSDYLKEATIHNVKTCYGWVTTAENGAKAMKLKKR